MKIKFGIHILICVITNLSNNINISGQVIVKTFIDNKLYKDTDAKLNVENNIEAKIHKYFSNADSVILIDFSRTKINSSELARNHGISGLKHAEYFKYLNDIEQVIKNERPNIISIKFVFKNQEIITDLILSNLFTDEFKVKTSSGKNSSNLFLGVSYQGIVRGMNSLVAFNFFEGEFTGYLSTQEFGNINLGKLKNNPNREHIIYSDRDLMQPSSFACGTQNDSQIILTPRIGKKISTSSRQILPCISLFWETRKDIFDQHNSNVQNVSNYVISLFNIFNAIYINEGIGTKLNVIYIWDTTDPYIGCNSNNPLDIIIGYNSIRTDFAPADLAHLLMAGGGHNGVASGYGGICNNSTNYTAASGQLSPHAVSRGIVEDPEDFPQYTWPVFALAHETGHNLGSWHTHDCRWNGNNTQIDDCGNYMDNDPNPCYDPDFPILPTCGTIMSYCHYDILPNSEICFLSGFGSEPGELINDVVNECISNFCDNPPNTCTDNFESNNTYILATPFFGGPLGSGSSDHNLNANIGYQDDVDWFKLTLAFQGNLSITLSTLPYNYDIELYGPDGSNQPALAGSYNSGTQDEIINFTHSSNSTTTYYIKIYSFNPLNHSNASCYNLRMQWGSLAADLVVIEASVLPNSISPGGLATAYCKNKNQGSLTAVASQTSLWLSKDQVFNTTNNGTPPDINLNANISVPGLLVDQISTLLSGQFTIPQNTIPGPWHIMFKADAINQVIEGINENNNLIFIPITVTSNLIGLYWVGNSGNWNDGSHWSTSSGGTSCNCIPSLDDNVYFDANSFGGGGQSVNINENAFCKSMDWTGAISSSAFTGSSTLNIYGSLILNASMNVTYSGRINFKSPTPGNIIQTSGRSLFSEIYFEALGGEWTFQDNLNMPNNSIYFIEGSLNTNGKTVNAYQFSSPNNGIRLLTLGASTFNLSAFYACCSYVSAWNISGSNITINAGTSTINLTGDAGNFSSPSFTYYDVNFTGLVSGNLSNGSNGNFHNVSFSGIGNLSGNSNYNNVVFSKDGYFYGNAVFNNLTLAAGKSYLFNPGYNFTINNNLNANGTCATPTEIYSGSQGTSAGFIKSSGSINISYVRLRDITASGGATFTANNCTDLGNNNGWNISQAPSQNLYWIGNGGNWNDPNHWSLSSGGPSSGCIPTLYNNVFFDVNSFNGGGQSVNVNQLAYCKSMNWTGALSSSTLTGSSPINIYGSFILSSSMNITYNGQITFKSNVPGNNIQTFGKTMSSELYFDALGGEWTLQDNLNMPNNSINLNVGSLNTNDQTVNAYRLSSQNNGIRLLTLGGSTLNLSAYYACCSYVSAWNISGSNITINAGTSTINLTGDASNFSSPPFTYYDVNFTGMTSGALSSGSNGNFHNITFSGFGYLYSNSIYNNVIFLKDGYLYGNSTFNNLTLAAGKTFLFSPGSNFTFINNLVADGTCATPTELYSGSQGSPASLIKSSGNIVLNYVRLRDISSSGGATFTANNSTDLGDNNGWIFTPFNSQNFYWIGNGGNWTDGNHWSLSSGGPPSGCIPTLYDNVYFDNNSFLNGGQSVIINQLAYCKTMDWTGAISSSTLTGSSQLNIYGSWVLNPSMNITYTGQINFKSNNPGNIIQTFGKTLSSELYFDALGGEWTLQDQLNIPNNTIYHNVGSLNTNGETVNAFRFLSQGNGIRLLTLGASTLNFSAYYSCCSYYSGWYVSGPNLSINAGTSTINLSGDASNFSSPTYAYYDVNFTGIISGGLSAGSNSIFHNVTFSGIGYLYSNSTYNNVLFLKEGYLYGNSIFNNLTLATGKTYFFSAGGNFTVNNNLAAEGTCATPIEIYSTSLGTSANFIKSSGSININYVRLQDITATGGAIFTANNCTDLGNNNGWNINESSSQNLYWIGNGGNWNDPNHWSLSSGGVSSGCIPTLYNNVFFDSNSFNGGGQSVIINQLAYCKSMDWTGAIGSSTLTGNFPLHIYGSLILNSSMNITYTGQVFFNSNDPGNIVHTFGKTMSSELYFDALGGEWTLQDHLNMPNNSIYLNIGSLNTNGKTVNAFRLLSQGNGIRLLTLGASTLNFSAYYSCCSYYSGWNVSGSNLSINAGTSTINLTGGESNFSSPAFTYYNVNFTGIISGSLSAGSNSTFHNVTFSGFGYLYSTSTYSNVVFLDNGYLYSNSTFDNLTLTAGKTYLFFGGVFTFYNNINASGNPGNYISITGTGGFATFTKPGGSACLDYVTMENIHTAGEALFFAGANSNNLGGNVGWSFTSCNTSPPATPPSPISNSPQCNIVTLTASGIPPSGVVWYWQGISCGTITNLGSGPTFQATTSGTYYLRAYNYGCACWSPGCSSVTVEVNQTTARTWTGLVSSDWTNANNWTCGTAPYPNSDVTIPSGTPFSPVVPSGMYVWCRSLTVLSGANLTIDVNARLNLLNF